MMWTASPATQERRKKVLMPSPNSAGTFLSANAALDVFNSLSTGVNVCVLSNGVLLGETIINHHHHHLPLLLNLAL
jgi:hypothetical protein